MIRRVGRFGIRLSRGSVRRSVFVVLAVVRVARNLSHRVLNRSDQQRWSDLTNHEKWWDERTAKIARLIPAGSRVIEFGAGRRQLANVLDSSCSYTPSDLVERGPGTFVCDLNQRPLPSLSHLGADTAVFGGVLEYIHDVQSLVKWLAEHVSTCVASYACTSTEDRMASRMRHGTSRYYYGYMNSYSEADLISLFQRAGFRCIARDPWNAQRMFVFVKQHYRE